MGAEPANGLACTTCHNDLTKFTLYPVKGVPFPSGKTVSFSEKDDKGAYKDAVPANLCLECHQGRQSTATLNARIGKNEADKVPETKLSFANVHYFAAGASLFGNDAQVAYQYADKEYAGRNMHAPGFTTCTDCHSTHELGLNSDKCVTCHAGVKSAEEIRFTKDDLDGDKDVKEGVAGELKTMEEKLYAAMQAYAKDVAKAAIVYDAVTYPYFFADANANGKVDEGETGLHRVDPAPAACCVQLPVRPEGSGPVRTQPGLRCTVPLRLAGGSGRGWRQGRYDRDGPPRSGEITVTTTRWGRCLSQIPVRGQRPYRHGCKPAGRSLWGAPGSILARPAALPANTPERTLRFPRSPSCYNLSMSETRLLEVPIAGMDCAECTEHVRHAIAALPGVVSVDVFLASEKAAVRLDPAQVSQEAIRDAVEGAGYRVAAPDATSVEASGRALTRQLGLLLAALFGVVLFVAVVGEGLGLFERLTDLVPWPIWLALIVIAGYPVFRNVVRATLHRQIISHTLMTIGVLAAIAVGQWMTALVVVFFMRVGDAVERFTTDRARRSLKSLTALAPRTARVDRDGAEVELPIDQLRPGDIVIVRPGEQIPADGEVLDGQATVDQAAITGESLPVETGPGSRVYAATIARLGHLRIRVTHAGADTTYGRVVQQVEEAEANRADIQRTADRFSTYFLPIVLGIAALTFLLSRDPLATAAVLVVACSCSIALATPIAVLASVGAAAKRGLLIKGGRYLELLDRADVLLVDKTGTVTLGKPEITDVLMADGKWQMANSK